jgi:hypothetical protein
MGRWASTEGVQFFRIVKNLRQLIYINLINHKEDQILESVASVAVLDSETTYWCQIQAGNGKTFELRELSFYGVSFSFAN